MIDRLSYLLFAALLVGLTGYGVVRAALGRTGDRIWVVALVVIWALATLLMTARPGSGSGQRVNLELFRADGFGDAVLNTAVFVPLGLLLAICGARLLVALAVAFGISLGIELVQYTTGLGRTADINDLLSNTLGALIGWGAARLVGRPARRSG